MKNENKGFKHLLNSTKYSLQGLVHAAKNEAAFRQELLFTGILFVASFFVSEGFIAWAILVSPLFLLLIVELLNSAIEAVVDRIGEEYHELSGRAKDMGSAAVFINLLLIGVIWTTYLVQHFLLKENSIKETLNF